MTTNPMGEVTLPTTSNGDLTLKLTWSGLVRMQRELGFTNPDELLQNIGFEQMLVVLKHLLAGGGRKMTTEEVAEIEIDLHPFDVIKLINEAFTESGLEKFQQEAAATAPENPTN